MSDQSSGSDTAAARDQKPDAVLHADIVPMVWFSCALAALAGLLFGMDIGVISGALPFIKQDFHVSTAMEGWIVSSMMVGAALGALMAGGISQRFGRRKALLYSSLLFFVGALVAVIAPNTTVLVIARILLGLAVGVASFTAPLYLSEVAPERIRGTTISFYQLMVTIGILAAFVSNLAFSYVESWRWMFGVLMIPAFMLFLGVLMVPTSPRWLAARDRFDEAREVLQRLRSSQAEVDYEMKEIQESVESESQSRGWDMFKENPNFRRSVMLGICLQLVQQFTGMNAIMYFAPQIFQLSGFEGTAAQLWSTVVTGLINVLATFIAIGFIDRLGRKPILYAGFTIMATSMAVLALILGIGPSTTFLQYTAMGALLIFVAGFAMSAGPLIWTLCAEIQPLHGRDFGISASTVSNWVGNFAVGQFFPVMIAGIGGTATFGILAGLNAVFIVLTFMLIPETKGISLESIEKKLMSGKALRNIGS
ncbi:SP family galactose:H+ symporter-like MFS transporter [Kushneria sinocarnis]|uniref:SP family galactose:H+ symporter-like MFS transporter n=1 Tax=Kushneria sinocarnis TaxID=595502 RepID=A0A420WX50_9GAMM|nr:sugar porter family MFS transporter [Kushneria sinocarnis]RKR04331.1 SP family galactose:H+ symporter-like MFS transporter [Kushneria sinocarnis]